METVNAMCIDDPTVVYGYHELVQKYGAYSGTHWPHSGCGAPFVPWKKGASQVVEVRLADGTWAACATGRLPHGTGWRRYGCLFLVGGGNGPIDS